MTTPTPAYQPDRATQEEQLLGVILIDAVYYGDLRRTVLPAHFQDKRNRLVWEAFERLYASHTAILFRSVCQELAHAGVLQDAGGGYRLLALINNTPSSANPVVLAQSLTGQSSAPVEPLNPAAQIAGRIKGLLLRLPVGTPSVEVLYEAHDELLRLGEMETLVRRMIVVSAKIVHPETDFDTMLELGDEATNIQTRLNELLGAAKGQ